MKTKSLVCSFRRAQPGDCQQIQDLYFDLVRDPNIRVTSGSIAAITEDQFNILIVGETDGRIVATAFMTICRDVMYDDQPFAVVENVIVANGYKGFGIGTQMMEWIKSEAKHLRCTKIMLLSSSKRPEAHRFFERCGYHSDTKRGFVNYINRS